MLDKPSDVPYCGVRESKIRTATPILNQKNLALSWEWINERYEIHLQKDVYGRPAPWTENQVLQRHKFTNVRREDDRQSKWYISNIAESNMTMEQKVVMTIMFRMFNIDTYFEFFKEEFGSLDYEDMMTRDIGVLRHRMQMAEQKREMKWFTNAFNTGGLKQSLAFPEVITPTTQIIHPGGEREEVSITEARNKAKEGLMVVGFEPYMPLRVVSAVRAIDPCLVKSIVQATDQLHCFDLLRSIRGLSYFLAYQIFVDLTYCPEFKFSENHFTIAGPGCKDGLDLIFEDKDGMTHEECLFWLRDNQDEVYGLLGYDRISFWEAQEHIDDKCFNVMCLENISCEFSKYHRCVEALKVGKAPRTKVGYDGTGSKPQKKQQVTTTAKRLW